MRSIIDVSPTQIPEILSGCSQEEIEASVILGNSSWPLRAGYVDGEFLFLFGLVAPTLLSESAYIWLHTSEAVDRHKIAAGRWAKAMLVECLESFPILVGHCKASSQRWIGSLGATFRPGPIDYITFELRRGG